jgi:dephospho-CoA kinase
MLRVGLTGGIGCGKSTVSALFETLNVPVIDADRFSHDLVKPGQPALVQIADEFGNAYLTADGTLDRAKLRSLVFNNQHQKQKLEAIIHPHIFKAIDEALTQLTSAYCILSIPLLFETGMKKLVDRVLVVDCTEEEQISRVKLRDHLPEETIRAIMRSQISRAERLSQADDIIENTGKDIVSLREQVERLHNFYHVTALSLR